MYRYFTTFILSKSAGYVVKSSWGYFSWHCILLSIAIFVFIKNLNFDAKIKSNKLKKCLANVAGCSFGIYLLHMIVIYYIIEIFKRIEYSWSFRTIGILVVYLISLGIVFILKRIPIIKKVVP